MSLPTSLSHLVTRLVCTKSDGTSSIGTAFYFSIHEKNETYQPLLVTNKHVIKGAIKTKFRISQTNDNGEPIPKKFYDAEIPSGLWVSHPDPSVDLCAMQFGSIVNNYLRDKKIAWTRINQSLIPNMETLKSLSPVEDVVMIGYPAGIWDEHNNMPIYRKGITATHPALEYNGKREFMVDIAAFPGSSGSPVFLFKEGMRVTNTTGKSLIEKPGGGLFSWNLIRYAYVQSKRRDSCETCANSSRSSSYFEDSN